MIITFLFLFFSLSDKYQRLLEHISSDPQIRVPDDIGDAILDLIPVNMYIPPPERPEIEFDE